MRIVFDARFTRTDQHDGISRYGASLIEAVSRHADVRMLISDERQLALLPPAALDQDQLPALPCRAVRVPARQQAGRRRRGVPHADHGQLGAALSADPDPARPDLLPEPDAAGFPAAAGPPAVAALPSGLLAAAAAAEPRRRRCHHLGHHPRTDGPAPADPAPGADGFERSAARYGTARSRPGSRRSRCSTWVPSCRTRTSRRSCAAWTHCRATPCTCSAGFRRPARSELEALCAIRPGWCSTTASPMRSTTRCCGVPQRWCRSPRLRATACPSSNRWRQAPR